MESFGIAFWILVVTFLIVRLDYRIWKLEERIKNCEEDNEHL